MLEILSRIRLGGSTLVSFMFDGTRYTKTFDGELDFRELVYKIQALMKEPEYTYIASPNINLSVSL